MLKFGSVKNFFFSPTDNNNGEMLSNNNNNNSRNSSSNNSYEFSNCDKTSSSYGGVFEVLNTNDIRNCPLLKSGDSAGYVVQPFYDSKLERLFVLGGSVDGHLLMFHLNSDHTQPCCTFVNNETMGTGHIGVIRSALFVSNREYSSLLFTSGEDGRMCMWKQ